MDEFELNYILENIMNYINPCANDRGYNYIIKIYKNGNIDIKRKDNYNGIIIPALIINDNIPIPKYVIDIFKEMLTKNFNYGGICRIDIDNYITILKKLKEDYTIEYKKELSNKNFNDENIKLKEENEQLKEQIKHLKELNEQIKTNKIINYYC